jgi:drug/metabolite transporter (DMT)-like permease
MMILTQATSPPNMVSKKTIAIGELVLAAMIWGYAFIAIHWILQSLDAVSASLIRFTLAFAFGSLFFLNKNLRQEFNKKNILMAAGPGFFLGLTLSFQTWGLTNSGFITTLYVVIVPFIEILIFRKMPNAFHAIWVALALLGTAMMTNLHLNGVNKGDIYTLLCAFCAAIQIVWVGHISHKIKSAFAFNVLQCFWSAVATLVFWPVYGNIRITPLTPLGIWGFVLLIFGSTLFAFALQIRAQKIISPSVASLIFLLESPFAALFAMLILKDTISLSQGFGGLLILFSSAAAIYTAEKNNKKVVL